MISPVGKASAGILWALLGVVWLGVVLPRTGIASTGLFFWSALAIVLFVCVVTGWRIARERGPRVRHWVSAWAAPVIGTASFLYAIWKTAGLPRFLMNNDMVWNTAQSLFIHRDGGVWASEHPNPAPMTNMMFALSYGPAHDLSLRTVLHGHVVVVLLLAATASLLPALFVAQWSRRAHPVFQVALTLVVGWLPYTGAILGITLGFGFANFLTSYVVLWLVWISFTEATGLYRVTMAAVSLTVVIATWAPLAVFPGVLGLAALCGLRKSAWRAPAIATLALAVFQFIAYGVCVTLPDLRRSGVALAANGSTPPFEPPAAMYFSVLIVLATLFTLAMLWKDKNARYHALALFGVVGGLAVGCAYLMDQRRHAGIEVWGYYPVKYALVAILVVVGILIAFFGKVAGQRPGLFSSAVVTTMAVALAWVAFLTPVGWVYGESALAPAVVYGQLQEATFSADVEELIRVHDTRGTDGALFIGWNGIERDQFLNDYLIQLSAERAEDPMRMFAYTFRHDDEAHVCQAIVTWDRDVTVYTRPENEERLSAWVNECPVAHAVSVTSELP